MRFINTNIDLGDSWILTNRFLNPKLSIEAQVDILAAHMLTIAFGEGQYIIDIGWYPFYNLYGSFRIYIIENQDWQNPIFEERPTTLDALDKELVACYKLIKDKTNGYLNYPVIEESKKVSRNSGVK